MTPRALRTVVVVVTAFAVVIGVDTIVRASDGAFSGQYALSGTFSKAGEGLHAGSAVTYRGVQVGRVSTIDLVRRQARVGMLIDPGFHVPSDATATIEPINVFGAEEVALTFPSASAPALAPGATLTRTAVSPELGDLFAAADPLLAQIDTADLSAVISDLAQASQGEGPTVAASIDEGAQLADLLDRTLPAQLQALDSFDAFGAALTPTASSLEAIADASNVALPAFNRAADSYAQLLQTLSPFAENLAQLLSAYHPDIETLLDQGDNVARLLLADQSQIGQVIEGLGVYMQRFADALDPDEVLPDGSHFGYFQSFVLFDDLNTFVCDLLAPAAPGLSFLGPLQQALTGAGAPLDCSSQEAAFDAAQETGAPSSAASASQASATTTQAGQQLSTAAYGALGQPEVPSTTGVGSIITSILGTVGGLTGSGSTSSGGAATSGSGTGGSGTGGSGLLGGLLP